MLWLVLKPRGPVPPTSHFENAHIGTGGARGLKTEWRPESEGRQARRRSKRGGERVSRTELGSPAGPLPCFCSYTGTGSLPLPLKDKRKHLPTSGTNRSAALRACPSQWGLPSSYLACCNDRTPDPGKKYL